MAGEKESTLRRWTHAWFEEEVIPNVAPATKRALAWHRSQGHPLVLLTSSSRYESEAATRYFVLDDFLSMGYEVRHGRFTGDVERPMCYGEGRWFTLSVTLAIMASASLTATSTQTASPTCPCSCGWPTPWR